jgi:hypothetical protein
VEDDGHTRGRGTGSRVGKKGPDIPLLWSLRSAAWTMDELPVG